MKEFFCKHSREIQNAFWKGENKWVVRFQINSGNVCFSKLLNVMREKAIYMCWRPSTKMTEKWCMVWVIRNIYDWSQKTKWFEPSKNYMKSICMIRVTQKNVFWVRKNGDSNKSSIRKPESFIVQYDLNQAFLWFKSGYCNSSHEVCDLNHENWIMIFELSVSRIWVR